MTGPWSLERRITRWCVGIGTGFVALLGLVGGVLTHIETERELDAIADEELEEMVGGFATSQGRREDFEITSEALQRSHPDDGMAWRVWSRADGTPWAAHGRRHLSERMPVDAAVDPEVRHFERFRRGRLNDELDVALLLEGGREVQSERLFLIVAGSTVIGAAILSWLAGRLLGRRIGGLLLDSAAETRAAMRAEDLGAAPGDLPAELAEVVSALRGALARIRDESDRARLLASGLAHELRSPLQNLLTQLEVSLLRERTNAEYVTTIERQLVDLQELIRAVDNLVTLCASPEAQRARHSQTFDLAAEARLRLATEIERAARERVRVDIDFPPVLPVRGDRETLVLALRNLLANAIEWSPEGGRVDVRLTGSDGTCAIEVDDQGPGVPEDERERIFRPFERGTRQAKRRIGYGLGLALVRTVAELHCGTVEVSRSPAGGARFRLQFPVALAQHAAP